MKTAADIKPGDIHTAHRWEGEHSVVPVLIVAVDHQENWLWYANAHNCCSTVVWFTWLYEGRLYRTQRHYPVSVDTPLGDVILHIHERNLVNQKAS